MRLFVVAVEDGLGGLQRRFPCGDWQGKAAPHSIGSENEHVSANDWKDRRSQRWKLATHDSRAKQKQFLCSVEYPKPS